MKIQMLRALLALHVAVLLFGSAGVVGKTLSLSALVLVFGRTFFAALSLLPLLLYQRQLSLRGIPKTVVLCGVLLAMHWLTFFASLNYASVAYGLMGFASFPLFVAWLEPLVFKEERHRRDWLAAIAVVLGMAVMVSDTSWESGALAGLLLGVASGLSFALLTLANRWQGIAIPPFKLAFLQNAVACISLLPFVFSENSTFQLDKHDWWGLLLLGAVFTALSHGLFMFSLRQLSTGLASMTASLEPVYGIALAYAVLNEVPTLRMLLGCAIVLAATTLATYWHRH